jgi:hypothetical protein
MSVTQGKVSDFINILRGSFANLINALLKRHNMPPRIYSLDSKPYGLTYEEWAVRWWQWLLSISSEDNPAYDTTGQNSAQNQIDSRVWFLAGTTNYSAPMINYMTLSAIAS